MPGDGKKNNPLKLFGFLGNRWEFQCEILHVYVTILSTIKCPAEFNNI